MVWMLTDKRSILYIFMLANILDTKKPAIINPKENDALIKPIVPSEYPWSFWTITNTVKKYPIAIPVKNEDIDKYLILGFILLKSR